MQKFTNMGNEDKSLNESVSTEETTKISIDKLLETLSIEIEGDESEITVDYKVKPTDKFYEGIKTVINEIYHKEKIALLEKARMNHLLNNVAWIDEEMDSIKESIKNDDKK
jgi:uncharacterized protein involved in exopolysaccharide biosynthesis